MSRCNRCEFDGDLSEHAAEAGHPLCIVCERRSLTEFDRQTCDECANRVRDDLTAIVDTYTDLHFALLGSAHRGVNADTLALLGDGSTQGGGPDDHIRFHDPCSAAAALERLERDWREEFGHGGPDYPPLGSGKWQSRRPAHVFTEAARYLATWHTLAARTHPGFDDYAQEIGDLRFRLQLVAGRIDFPRRDPLPCSCGGKLVQDYGEKGLEDARRCRECGTPYPPKDYAWRMRMVTDTPGWISLEQAASRTGRPLVTLKAWAASLALPTICHRLTRRLLVDEAAVTELHEERATRRRAG